MVLITLEGFLLRRCIFLRVIRPWLHYPPPPVVAEETRSGPRSLRHVHGTARSNPAGVAWYHLCLLVLMLQQGHTLLGRLRIIFGIAQFCAELGRNERDGRFRFSSRQSRQSCLDPGSHRGKQSRRICADLEAGSSARDPVGVSLGAPGESTAKDARPCAAATARRISFSVAGESRKTMSALSPNCLPSQATHDHRQSSYRCPRALDLASTCGVPQVLQRGLSVTASACSSQRRLYRKACDSRFTLSGRQNDLFGLEIDPGKWHATRCPAPISTRAGVSATQRAAAAGQRVRK